MERGIATVAKDFFFAGWNNKAGEDFRQNPLGFVNMQTSGIDQTIPPAGNYAKQIAANRGPVYASTDVRANSVASQQLRVFRLINGNETTRVFRKTIVRPVPRWEKDIMFAKASPGSPLATADDVEEIVGGHRLVDLFIQVNDYMDTFALKYITVQYLDLTGNCYWALVRDTLGLPAAIWIVPSEHMTVVPDGKVFLKGYQFKRGSTKIFFEKEDVIHFKKPAAGDKFVHYGRATIMGARDAVNLRQEIQTFEEWAFKNQGVLSGILKTATRTNEEQRKQIRQQMHRIYGGSKNAEKIGIFENLEWQQLSMTPREMAYQTGRSKMSEEIYNVFGVPVAMMTGQTSTRAGLDASMRQIALFTVLPLECMIAQTLNAQLIPQYPEPLWVEFPNPVPEDQELQMAQEKQDLEWGVIGIDEARVVRGKPELGGAASEPMVNASRFPLSVASADMDDDDDEAEEQGRRFGNAVIERLSAWRKRKGGKV